MGTKIDAHQSSRQSSSLPCRGSDSGHDRSRMCGRRRWSGSGGSRRPSAVFAGKTGCRSLAAAAIAARKISAAAAARLFCSRQTPRSRTQRARSRRRTALLKLRCAKRMPARRAPGRSLHRHSCNCRSRPPVSGATARIPNNDFASPAHADGNGAQVSRFAVVRAVQIAEFCVQLDFRIYLVRHT
jgi:hypothetical protein